MTSSADPAAPRRALSREKVVRTAIRHADAGGLEALSMRTLAGMLGVAPMALYRHVVDKDDLIDAMVDVAFSEIGLPTGGSDWRTAMWDRAVSLRGVLSRHRWAIGLMESRRRPGPANLRHHDAVIGKLRSSGFDLSTVAHAYSLLDSYVYGFSLTRLNVPLHTSVELAEMAEDMFRPFPAGEYPNLSEFVSDHVMRSGYDYEDEFAHGLQRILDAIDRALPEDRRGGRTSSPARSAGHADPS